MRAQIARGRHATQYIHQSGVLEWMYGDAAFLGKLMRDGGDGERHWGSSLIGNDTAFWTAELGEGIVNDLLLLRGERPRRIKDAPRAANAKRLVPDRATDRAIYECKTRSYAAATGTVGEKILGCPIKYCEVPRLYRRPLYIVCVGYQEAEAARDFQLFDPQSPELRSQIDMWKKNRIEFVGATAMLEAALGRN